MRKPLVAGNWKMNGTLTSINPLVEAIKTGQADPVEIVLCPSAIYLAHVASLISDCSIALGGQNVSEHEQGAYTGEIACDMLKDCSCQYVILGHSERRSLYGEDSEQVAAKFIQAQKHDLIPILCVGESQQQRESGATEEVVGAQLRAVLDRVGADGFKQAVIAYEPVWAIGTGLTATPEQAQQVHAFIRNLVAEYEAERQIAEQLRILYGGSVKADNAKQIFAMQDIDGGLIGGAALKAEDFLEICHAAKA